MNNKNNIYYLNTSYNSFLQPRESLLLFRIKYDLVKYGSTQSVLRQPEPIYKSLVISLDEMSTKTESKNLETFIEILMSIKHNEKKLASTLYVFNYFISFF